MGDWVSKRESDSKPLHSVCLDDFYIGKFEVTLRQWEEVMGSDPSRYRGYNDCPVKDVSWYQARLFISKLKQKTGKKYRLPTEAEWEFAARSRGKKEIWAGTNNESELEKHARSVCDVDKETDTIKTKKPNSLGIHDMSGSVWEWVEDWYDKDYYRKSLKNNPKGPSTGEVKVLRGGTWLGPPLFAPTYERHSMVPEVNGASIRIGLRLALPAH